MIARAFILAGFASLATPALATVATGADYVCTDGTRLRALFLTPRGGSPIVHIVIDGNKITLPEVKSADGGRYANSEMEFWIRGKEAKLTRAGRSETCQSK